MRNHPFASLTCVGMPLNQQGFVVPRCFANPGLRAFCILASFVMHSLLVVIMKVLHVYPGVMSRW